MEAKLCAIFLFVVFGVVAAYPANTKDEVEFVPLEHQRPSHHAGIGDDYDYPDRYFPNPFDISGLSDGFEAMLQRMRQHIASLFRNTPSKDDFPVAAEGFPAFPNLGGIDLGKGNTTSVTKVIDGHKVVINETDYKSEGPNAGTYFKVRIIDVQPENPTGSTPSQEPDQNRPTEGREVEPLEDSIENEIVKNKEGSIYDNVEAFDDVDYGMKGKELDWDDVEPLETLEGNAVNTDDQQQYHDLSNDIYINQLMADAGAPTNPDAEFIPGFERQPRVDSMEVKRRIR